jgi:hypothetical protein
LTSLLRVAKNYQVLYVRRTTDDVVHYLIIIFKNYDCDMC